MSQDQDTDRNQDATQYKLDEARKKGSVARSTDLQSFAVIAAATLALFALAHSAVQAMARLLASHLTLSRPYSLDDAKTAATMVHVGTLDALLIIAPLLFIVAVTVLLTGVLQTKGLLFSTTPITPDFNRLNPVAGFKRLFSLKLIYEAGKSVFKLAALVLVACLTVRAALPGLSHLMSASNKGFVLLLIDASATLSARLCGVLGLFALIDLVFSRWEFHRGLRMSRREQEDEHKHRDGDPRIKSRLRELRLEFLKRTRSVAGVPNADVLITNPTHVAIALKYEHGVSPAPQVIAKGAGAVAKTMRDVAYRARVPIVQSPALARALYKEVPQDSYLPERWYPQVAKILVWVQAAKAARLEANALRGSTR